ncbi:hypothetical protein C8R44DRAFT_919626 [Mycena epipterygia]|nr:hypothetical protein C8R44DRAFT_919626 [Mycena epipterygia]
MRQLTDTTNGNTQTVSSRTPRQRDTWYYPSAIADDLNDVDLPGQGRDIGLHIHAFRGELVDVTTGDNILGHSLSGTLSALFVGTPGHEEMAREFRTYVLVTSDKASNRRYGELFRRSVDCLALSPSLWFRIRSCDFLARFTIAAALACNGADDVCVAFYKHRSEGETHKTFAYMPEDIHVKAFRQYREVLWALDAMWARRPKMQIVINFLRLSATEVVVTQTRANVKLWNRVDANELKVVDAEDIQRYRDVLSRRDELLFHGLAEILETGGDGHCNTCHYRASYGAETSHRFGGVELCDGCRAKWREFLESFPERAAQVFPELQNTYNKAISSDGL